MLMMNDDDDDNGGDDVNDDDDVVNQNCYRWTFVEAFWYDDDE